MAGSWIARRGSLDSSEAAWKTAQNHSDSKAVLVQKRSDSRLGRKLFAARLSAHLTQAQLGDLASCSVRGVWMAEAGLGHPDHYLRMVDALGMEVVGRSLPPGEHLGARLLALRARMGMSLRELAAASDISRTTLAAVEAGRLGHLASVERVADALGARLTLAARGGSPGFFTQSALSSAWDAWATPFDILDRLYRVMDGAFDLDPCSPGRGRCRVRAGVHYTAEDDGLALPWNGRVYMNAP